MLAHLTRLLTVALWLTMKNSDQSRAAAQEVTCSSLLLSVFHALIATEKSENWMNFGSVANSIKRYFAKERTHLYDKQKGVKRESN